MDESTPRQWITVVNFLLIPLLFLNIIAAKFPCVPENAGTLKRRASRFAICWVMLTAIGPGADGIAQFNPDLPCRCPTATVGAKNFYSTLQAVKCNKLTGENTGG